MRTFCAALALSVGALGLLCTHTVAADMMPPSTAPVVQASGVAPPITASCYRFILQQWSWYDYCWAERNPVAWRTHARPLRVRG